VQLPRSEIPQVGLWSHGIRNARMCRGQGDLWSHSFGDQGGIDKPVSLLHGFSEPLIHRCAWLIPKNELECAFSILLGQRP